MEKPPPQPPVFGENIAGRLFDVARDLQKNREKYSGVTHPTPVVNITKGQEVMNALMKKKSNGQEQNAASAPGALQEKRS